MGRKVALVLGALTCACGAPSEPETTTVHLALEQDNGTSLNGTSFGGWALQSANYLTWASGIAYQFPTYVPYLGYNPYGGIAPNGESFDGVEIDGFELAVVRDLEDALELQSAHVEGELSDGRTVQLAVSGLSPGPAPNDDVLYFNMVVDDGYGWAPVCGTNDQGEPIPAIAVPGVWDHRSGHKDGGKWKHKKDEFTFACRGSSIAKCVEAGYKPWLQSDEKKWEKGERVRSDFKKANHLQACVRMLRADYCEDGTSWTVNGRRIEFWDNLGLHDREREDWSFEAAWGTDGLECMVEPRVAFPGGKKPKCIKKLEKVSKCEKGGKDVYLMSAFESQLAR